MQKEGNKFRLNLDKLGIDLDELNQQQNQQNMQYQQNQQQLDLDELGFDLDELNQQQNQPNMQNQQNQPNMQNQQNQQQPQNQNNQIRDIGYCSNIKIKRNMLLRIQASGVRNITLQDLRNISNAATNDVKEEIKKESGKAAAKQRANTTFDDTQLVEVFLTYLFAAGYLDKKVLHKAKIDKIKERGHKKRSKDLDLSWATDNEKEQILQNIPIVNHMTEYLNALSKQLLFGNNNVIDRDDETQTVVDTALNNFYRDYAKRNLHQRMYRMGLSWDGDAGFAKGRKYVEGGQQAHEKFLEKKRKKKLFKTTKYNYEHCDAKRKKDHEPDDGDGKGGGPSFNLNDNNTLIRPILV